MRRVVAEITWLVRLLDDLSVPSPLHIPLHSNSQAAIHITKNPVFHERMKHVDHDCHFVRQQYLAGLISLWFVPYVAQFRDVFTNPLSGPIHRSILPKLRIVSPPSNLRGDVGISNSKSVVISDFSDHHNTSCLSQLRDTLKKGILYKLRQKGIWAQI